jgi:putative tryptophan/tyrosine transport system substrate-binding protein
MQFDQLKRRDFITLLGGAAVAWPRAVRAQQPAMPVIGFLNSTSPGSIRRQVAAFHQGLKDAGYVEGQNAAVEYRWAQGQYERLPALAAELVQRPVAVLAATSTPAALAAKAATTTVPTVFTTAANPVELGLVASLSRPGGNVTGATQLNVEIGPKRLELVRELIPRAKVVGLLVNPTNPAARILSRDLEAAARTLGLELHVLNASTERDIDDAFATLVQRRASALVFVADPFLVDRSEQLGALTLRHALPTIFQYPEFLDAGGLISYSGSATDSYRWAGNYSGRILKGEKPAHLPVHQSTKVELIINLKTARALGLAIPLSLLGRADEVIE